MNIFVYRFCKFVLYLLFKLWNRFEIIGEENLPDSSQGYLIASNHVSYLDPPVLGGGLKRPITFLAKEKLFSITWLKGLIESLGALPVAGQSDLKSLRRVVRALRSGQVVTIFPEGTRAGEEALDPGLGVGFLAHVSDCPIIPCYIHGTAQAWPKGQRWIKPSKIRVFIGKPIYSKTQTKASEKQKIYREIANETMTQIRKLKGAIS